MSIEQDMFAQYSVSPSCSPPTWLRSKSRLGRERTWSPPHHTKLRRATFSDLRFLMLAGLSAGSQLVKNNTIFGGR